MRAFGERLKRLRERARLTQGQAAAQVSVRRATFAQWETGRHLPTEKRVHELDRLLGARGELIAAVEQVRPTTPGGPVDSGETAVPAGRPSLLQVLDSARTVLLQQLCHDDSGHPTGWRHNLVPSPGEPSVASTAYGLKVLATHGGPDARTPAVVRWVLDQAVCDEGRCIGWKARAQVAPRIEITAAVIDGLLRAGVELDADEVIRMLDDLVDETALTRPSILSMAVATLLRIAPHAELNARLINALLDCRVAFNGVLLWPEQLLHERDQRKLTPSLAHTAQAVTVLRGAPEGLVGDAVSTAEQWVAENDNLNGITESIARKLGASRDLELLPLHRFTSSWVVRALAGATRPDRRRIERALGYVWDRYDPISHVWAWGNGDTPVWMLNDAVAALHDAALALQTAPLPEPDPG